MNSKVAKKLRKEARRELRRNYSLKFKDKPWYFPNFVWKFLLKLVAKEEHNV